MCNVSVNSTCGEIRTPESILIDAERARFREAVLTQALAAVTSDYLRLVLHCRFMLGWNYDAIAQEFRIDPRTASRAEARGLELMRVELAKHNVHNLRDIL